MPICLAALKGCSYVVLGLPLCRSWPSCVLTGWQCGAEMIVVGLTGGIATGKSTTADLFRERGIVVFDADRSVHYHMSGAGPAVAEICAIFGEEVLREDGSIDRNLLGHYVFRNEVGRQKLEQILHPLVARDRAAFLARGSDRTVRGWWYLTSLCCLRLEQMIFVI